MSLSIFLKLLRVAMGYGSRTERMQRMLHHPNVGVAMIAHSMVTQGWFNKDTGSIEVPKDG